MSSAEEDYNDVDNPSTLVPGSKKRRVQRACDTCRRKKSDGSQMPGNRCSNCIAYSFECSYIEAAKKRGPPKGYVESLENRLEKMEKLLQKVCPDADFSRELGGSRIDRETWLKGNTGASASAHVFNATSATYNSTNTPLEHLAPSDDEEIVTLRLSERLQSMHLNPWQSRFFGKSSGVMLIQKAIDLKKEVTGSEHFQSTFFRQGEEECYPWERAARNIEEPEYIFPDEELGMRLVDIYFVYMHPLAPLFHRPSFERKIMQGVHLRNPSFGAVYLLVCAAASRHSDDPRVFLENTEDRFSERSAGWKFFEQVQMVRSTLLGPPCLEDLQTYCLSVLFLQGTSAPQACWTIVGIGIRLAQDVGAHRRKSYSEEPSVESELWKRAFWVLVLFDRQMSSSLGRPCAIQDEDFDLEFPIDCDDEYWEHPDPQQAFKQPPDKPSTISFFVSFLKLNNILSFAHRTIYSINKSKILLGFVGQQWEQHIVAELDSSLNKWIDEVPDYLRWDPTRDAHSIFFMQSTALYANYYNVQIAIHRPFIPSPRKPSPLSFPSLAICTNAARSCSHIIDIYRKRARGYAPFLQLHAFTAGIVLLLNIWGGKRSGLSTEPSKEMADVHKCMGLLKSCESRSHTAGRLWDILYELASVGDLPLPQLSPQGGTKRERDSDSPVMASRPVLTPKGSPRTIAGSRRVARDTHSQSQQSRQQQPPPSQPSQSYNLPVYSNDLGRLPLHGQVNFHAVVPTASTSSESMHPSNMWFSSLSNGTQQPANTAPAPMTGHNFVQEDAYSIDSLFLDQMSSPFGSLSSQQTHSPASHEGGCQPAANDLQAFMDATVAGSVQPSMMHTNAMLDVDPDTIAMWSSAPTGFGCVCFA
ncbi:hypothetical protein JVT61DRAFT_10973 [Boletus reticuloceps]|uniref:Zn(2)-C6 fungal-type domain-containing protein n=1 Tax=Boletus reticuloceps TaxID=495285 RepID=A0A8I3A4G6_9AGAM|nr:hypothetical protein JVT61DRAFT_10973 [Boletus reticuloceps]